jgi:WD40 repeat protein
MHIINSTIAALFIFGSAIAAPPTLSRHLINTFHGTKAGTDEQGNLWLWNSESRTVNTITPVGVSAASGVLPLAVNVDADARYGIATLVDGGLTIKVFEWNGRVANEVPLRERAGDIAWITGALVAVTPTFASHRIEIWDILRRDLVYTIDSCLPISQASGARIARATLIRYDRHNDQIVTLDATFGHIFVFRRNGKLVRETRLPVSPTPISQWLTEGGAPAATAHTSRIWRFPAVTVDANGDIWVSGDSRIGGISVFKYLSNGAIQQTQIDLPACTAPFVQAWQGEIILFGSGNAPSVSCMSIRDGATFPPVARYTQQLNGYSSTQRVNAKNLVIRPNATSVIGVCGDFCAYGCVCPVREGYWATLISCGCCSAPNCPSPFCCEICDYYCYACA